ncbi:hypothetical protein C2S51_016755 [Perilla frutescens var. frutescens]|nr:hypothetical protein C2S51_016755 [Perilla frutescens var. frutescens]
MEKACITSLEENNGSLESRRFYLSRRTLIEMLHDRGYVVPNMEILVVFCEAYQTRKQHAVGILSQIEEKEMLDKVILILQNTMNCHARKVLDAYPVKVETFLISDLLVNITKHFLEPNYEILSSEEKERLLKKHVIQDKQLPMMHESDAIAKYYGFEKGQVVKVSYGAGLPDSMVIYRCVV